MEGALFIADCLVVCGIGYMVYLAVYSKQKCEGPYCTLNNLENDWKEYENHIVKAVEILDTTMTDDRWMLMCKPGKGDRSTVEMLARSRYTYLRTVRSWVQEAFIDNINKYWHKPRQNFRPEAKEYKIESLYFNISDDLERPAHCAELHLDAAKEHAENLYKEMKFFLLDPRSSFNTDDTMEHIPNDCPSTRIKKGMFYLNGIGYARHNVELIDENLRDFIEIARSYGVE